MIAALLTSETPSEMEMFDIDILKATEGIMLEMSKLGIKLHAFRGSDILTALVWPSG